MGLPSFLLRKLYKRGSLRADGEEFVFTVHNPLADATLVAPPDIVVNGVLHRAETIDADVDLARISRRHPFLFAKGSEVELRLTGHLLLGGNRIHVTVLTREFGEIEFLVEDRAVRDDEE